MSNIYVVGADVSSTRIALVGSDLHRENVTTRKWDVMDRSGPEACKWSLKVLRRWVLSFPFDYGHRVIYIEAPVVAGARNIQSTIKQALINGIVQGVFGDAGWEVRGVAINTWKKTLIKGGCSKEVVAEEVARQWPTVAAIAGKDQDLLDAGGICIHGVQQQRSLLASSR